MGRAGSIKSDVTLTAMISKQLLAFQKLNITIEKDAANPFFKSSYSSLNEVLGKVKKPLNDLGVVIVQAVTTDGLVTQLIDTSDDTTTSSVVPFVGATDMQKLGGAITYARRYALVALLGLEDADDDGNVASAKSFTKAKASKDEDIF